MSILERTKSMNLFERAKNILLKPKEEWLVIDMEITTVQQLVTSYLIPLALIPALAAFIRYSFIGYGTYIEASLLWGIKQAIISFITIIAGVYLSAFVIDALAPSFSSVKNFRRAMQLVVYSYTPMLIVSIFQIIPGLGFLSVLGLYGLYLLYLGYSPIMKTPAEKVTGYFLLSLVVIIVFYFIVAAILTSILVGGSFGGSFIR